MATEPIRPIRSRTDHDAALARIEALWNAAPGTADHDEIEVLAVLVNAYEDTHYPIEPISPIETLRFHMEQNGLRQKDLAAVIGSESRASEIMRGRRPLTVEMIRRIHSAWHIPVDCLVGVTEEAAAG
jgi:HTH-type transcriptional regulator/antitoxin HigA